MAVQSPDHGGIWMGTLGCTLPRTRGPLALCGSGGVAGLWHGSAKNGVVYHRMQRIVRNDWQIASSVGKMVNSTRENSQGEWHGVSGQCKRKMAESGWQTADSIWQKANSIWQMADSIWPTAGSV